MLQNLHVKNLALIDEAEVEFGPGLNILTGETGAGKSILLGSVGLALGGKYNADMLRKGAKSGIVELTFTVDEDWILDKLREMEIEPENGMLTLSRRLTEGRSVSRINGETVNKNILCDVASLLIDIHGQHDSQTLLHKKNHLVLLDLYAKHDISGLREEMASSYRVYQTCLREMERFSLDEVQRQKELSLAEYEVKEIEEAHLTAGEDVLLEETYRRMLQSRRIAEGANEAYRHSGEDERGNASDFISRAIRALQDVSEFDEKGAELYGELLEIDSLLNDFNREIAEYVKGLEFSEEEFRETEDRLNLLNHLKAKYGSTVNDILAYCEEKRQRISELEDYDRHIRELSEKTADAFEKVKTAAEALHLERSRCAVTFAEEIRRQMSELNFLDSRLEIRVTDAGKYSANGKDDAEFYLSVNPGEPLRPLGSVASGGELSRIMLAIKAVLADEVDTPTLIFDEIDTGISGITAGAVGDKLSLLGASRQVICITHLPQIAAAADVHFLIQKEPAGSSVKTGISLLDRDGSVRELARMLGGANVTGSILNSAAEMKDLAKRER